MRAYNPIIVALDTSDITQALELVDQLGQQIDFYKIGLELMATGDYFKLIEALASRKKKIFADLKLYDVPQTVQNTVKQLNQYPIEYCTVHGHRAILEAAVNATQSIKILAVTVLTCLDQQDLIQLGMHTPIEKLVLQRAKNAEDTGCAGIISSAQEAHAIHKQHPQLTIVTPGIRMPSDQTHDQKRITTPKQALDLGASYIVIGRSITQNKNPTLQTKKIIESLKF